MIHELAQLVTAEEITDDTAERLGVDQLRRREIILVDLHHALANQTLGAQQSHAALILQQFANRAHAAIAQMVNVVNVAGRIAVTQTHQILGGLDKIFLDEHAHLGIHIATQLLVDLVTANQTQIITAHVKEHPLEQGLGILDVWRIARTQATINLFQRIIRGVGPIALQATNKIITHGAGIDNAHLFDAGVLHRLHQLGGERFKFMGNEIPLDIGGIADILGGEMGGKVLQFRQFRQRQFLHPIDGVKQLHIGSVTDGAQKRADQELAAATATIQINVDQIIDVELDFQPRTVIGNDAIGKQITTAGVAFLLEANARRTMQLADNDTLSSVDDEAATRRHDGHIAHINQLFLDILARLQTEQNMQRGGIGFAVLQAVNQRVLRVSDLIMAEIQDVLAVMAFNRKNFLDDFLKPQDFPRIRGRGRLQELSVGLKLDVNQIWNIQDILQLSEIFSCNHTASCWLSRPKDAMRWKNEDESGRGKNPPSGTGFTIMGCRPGTQVSEKPNYLSSTLAPAASS